MEFDRLGVFPYSQEEDTVAFGLPDQVAQEVKEGRRDELMELQQAISYDMAGDQVGRVLTVMVEGKVANEDVYVTRTYRDAPGVDGYLFLNTTAELVTGDFVKVLVTDSNEYDLIGETDNIPGNPHSAVSGAAPGRQLGVVRGEPDAIQDRGFGAVYPGKPHRYAGWHDCPEI